METWISYRATKTSLNKSLEDRVATQLGEIERIRKLERSAARRRG
ncbi:hypothetical protein ACTGJ9_007165 [Bradyrhizobium sp. RDM12]